MEGGAAVLLQTSIDQQSFPTINYHKQQQQKFRSQLPTAVRKAPSTDHHQLRRFNSMLLDHNMLMQMMHHQQHHQPQYHQYHGGSRAGTGGVFLNPSVSLYSSNSLPPSRQLSALNPQLQQQPPLLPLPVSGPTFQSLPTPKPPKNQSLTSSPTKTNRNNKATTKDKGNTTAPKTKPSSKSPKNNKKNMDSPRPTATTTTATREKRRSDKPSVADMTIMNRLGPDPENLPKDVSRVLLPAVASEGGGGCGDGLQDFSVGGSSSIFSLAPPPSSLPLPKFSVRHKLSCNAQAASATASVKSVGMKFDNRATDNLCRLLNLQY